MGISTETVLRGTIVMLPWVISLVAFWRSTNSTDPDSPMLSKRSSVFLIVLGLLLFITGLMLSETGILDGVIPEFKIIDVGYKMLGLLLVFYGNVGKGFKLVKVQR
jgi:hypothetical protein